MEMRTIAIIPARSGSKGLPDKNIKLFCGKPLIAWTIEAALKSQQFDEVMVSTDSETYAEIAKKYGAQVPFLRSEEMSSDTAGTWDTVREVIANYKKLGREFETLCLLQPTSPLRRAEDIVAGMNLFREKEANSVIAVCKLEHSIRACNTIGKDLSMDGFFDSNTSGRRQDAELYYRINGALYVQKVSELMQYKNLYGSKSYAYVMDKGSSLDIDDEIDFVMAENIYYKFYFERTWDCKKKNEPS